MVKLYSTHCPQCIMLENMLKQKKVKYELVKTTLENVEAMGYSAVPLLEVEGKILNFNEGMSWVRKQK